MRINKGGTTHSVSLVLPFIYFREDYMKDKKFMVPRGTQDVFGKEITKWHFLETKARELCKLNNIQEFRTPMYEHTEVFDRENDSSDMVNKEMYTFKVIKKDGESPSLTLRPEGTAGLIRAYVDNKLYGSGPSLQKYYYIAPNFRYERPQKGRMRIHHQFGIEYIGPVSPYVDAQALTVGLTYLKDLGVKNYKVLINTLGDKESQEQYKSVLKEHFEKHIDTMCSDCKRRLEQNPLRILDCKVDHDHEAIINAPKNIDSLNEESKEYFDILLNILNELDISYEIDEKLVRGLDYYHHTVFEVVSTNEKTGAQATIFAGGRYNELVSYFGGPQTGAFGFGIGLERLILFLEDEGIDISEEYTVDVYGMPMDTENIVEVMALMNKLHDYNISTDMDLENKSMKAMFKQADRLIAKVLVIAGEQEKQDKTFTLKNTQTKEQITVSKDKVLETIESWLNHE